jgi:hypothetical protein
MAMVVLHASLGYAIQAIYVIVNVDTDCTF